jgi:hypothetical protein
MYAVSSHACLYQIHARFSTLFRIPKYHHDTISSEVVIAFFLGNSCIKTRDNKLTGGFMTIKKNNLDCGLVVVD